jgi:DNA replication protein DnaC
VDDLGLRPLRGEAPYDLYEVIRRRYERGATIWTSNRDMEGGEWASLFRDPLLASAALDRLLHHSEILVLEGETYRNPRRKKRPKPRPKPSPGEEEQDAGEEEQGSGSGEDAS